MKQEYLLSPPFYLTTKTLGNSEAREFISRSNVNLREDDLILEREVCKINRMVAFILVLLSILATANLQSVKASGPIYIRPDGTVDPLGSPLQRSGDLYTLTANITASGDGIVVEKSNVIIDGNGYTIQGGASEHAFYMYGIKNVTIKNTRIEGFSYGIYLESTSQNAIHGNNITGSTLDGIGLYDSQNNTISFNNIKENGWSGIGLYFSSSNNISENYIENNYYGITFFDSQNNSILHNSFISNTNQTSSDISPNVWNDSYPSGGNYWSDHNNTDLYSGSYQNLTGSDGICDIYYTIDVNNQDNYPLTKPYGGSQDIGVTNITSKSIVGQGYKLDIAIKIINYGINTETFIITAYANTTAINQTQIILTSRNSTTITLTWNTTGFTGGGYVISAYAWPVPRETDTADNNCTGGWIFITKVGDLGGGIPPQFFECDGKVDGKDLSLFLMCFKGTAPPKAMYLGDLGGGIPPQFFKCDGEVDGKDLSLFLMCFKGLGP